MYRAVVVPACVLCASFATAAPAPIKRDQPLLGTSWRDKIDPDRDCRFKKDGDALVIEIPGKDHDLWPKDKKLNAPRLLKDIEGDFDVQVRVRIEGKVSEKSTAAKRASAIGAGVLITANDGSIVRIEYGHGRNKLWSGSILYTGQHVLSERHSGGGLMYNCGDGRSRPLPKNLTTVWIRVERRGREIRSSYSGDKKTWTGCPPHGLPLPDKVKVGVFAFSTSTEPFKPRFDDWKLTPVKSQEKKRE
jgi:regulation of enolase protein 1 (concanavalin A-like superfamily)